MNLLDHLAHYLDPLNLGGWRFFPEVGSTNDLALDWAAQGAQDWSLVLADAQTAGRGRSGRRWVTIAGGALAFSLVLRLSPIEAEHILHFTALGALGLIRALSSLGTQPQMKWPNDVLLGGRKVAGVLVEADWQADQAATVVIGIGVNISPQAVPPPEGLRYPATAVETELGRSVDRWALLAEIVRGMQAYRPMLGTAALVEIWNDHLALRGEWVRFSTEEAGSRWVKVIAVLPDGRLALEDQEGQQMAAIDGEIIMN